MTAVAEPIGETELVRVPSPPRAFWPIVGAVAFLLAAAAVGLLVGPVDIGVGAIFDSALSHVPLLGVHSHLSPQDWAIVWELRAPPVVLALLVGGMLALAGGSYQGVFRNPLVDPYLLGVAAGAGLGATIAISYVNGAASSNYVLPIAAFIGAAGAVALAYGLGATASGGRNPAALVLAGVTIVAFLTSIQTYIQQQHQQSLQEIYSWILGSVDTAGWHEVLLCLPYVVVASIVILLHRRLIDVLAVGDEEAATLGVNVRRVRITVVVFATIGTAAVVAVSGLIGFVGIIVPHFVRLAIGTSYRIVLPLSLLIGGGFLVLCDVIARTIVSPAELPIGVVTAFFGAPFFAIVLRTSRSFPVTGFAIDSVSVQLGPTLALDGVSAEVASGEWVALIGPNGAGKSTLLRAIAGLVRYSGSIELGGDEVSGLARREVARRLAFVPQAPLLPIGMRVDEYVLLGRTAHLGPFGYESQADLEAAGRALARLDLGALSRRRLQTLSGGEQQRAVLSRALVQASPLLLLDEPTTSLDIGRQQQALELVATLRDQSELTVVSAMHDITLAAQYADRLIVLSGGRLVADGPPDEIATAELVAEHYGADVRVVGEGGSLAVIPVRRA